MSAILRPMICAWCGVEYTIEALAKWARKHYFEPSGLMVCQSSKFESGNHMFVKKLDSGIPEILDF